jgi:hypothetical protein
VRNSLIIILQATIFVAFLVVYLLFVDISRINELWLLYLSNKQVDVLHNYRISILLMNLVFFSIGILVNLFSSFNLYFMKGYLISVKRIIIINLVGIVILMLPFIFVINNINVLLIYFCVMLLGIAYDQYKIYNG